MAETPRETEQTPAEHARAVVSTLLKENLNAAGVLDLAKFHNALLRHAREEADQLNSKPEDQQNYRERCTRDVSKEGIINLYYTAADEVLGFIPRSKWQNAQTLACNLRDWWLDKPIAATEFADNHGIVCKPSNNPQVSITNVLSCDAPPTPASIRKPDKGRS